MKKLALAGIVAATIVALTDCTVSKEAAILARNKQVRDSVQLVQQAAIDSRKSDSLKLVDIIMNYDGKNEMVLYRNKSRTYTIFNRDNTLRLEYIDNYAQDSAVRIQPSKISKFNETLVRNVLQAKNVLGDQNRPLVDIMDSICRHEQFYEDNFTEYFKLKLKTFEPVPLGDGPLIKGVARDYVAKCRDATDLAISRAKSDNYGAQVSRLYALQSYLDSRLAEKRTITDLESGIFRSKWVTVVSDKKTNNIIKSDTTDVIVVVAEYVTNTDYLNQGNFQDAHKAARNLLTKEIQKYTIRNITEVDALVQPYQDKIIRKTHNSQGDETKYVRHRAALIYFKVGSDNLTKQIIDGLTPYDFSQKKK
jgi:hypothetical protein